MYIDIAAIGEFLAICMCIFLALAQLWFFVYGALWFYRNTKDEPKKGEQ